MRFLLVRQTLQTLFLILMTTLKSLLLSVILSFLLLSRRRSALPLNVLLRQAIVAAVAAILAVAVEEEPLLLALALLLQLSMLQVIPDLRAQVFVLLGFLMSSQTQALVPSMAMHVICITPGVTLQTRALLSLA